MPGATIQRLRQTADAIEIRDVDVPELGDTQRCRGSRALIAPGTVLAARVMVRHAGVDHDQRGVWRQGHRFVRERARIDPQRRGRGREAARHLIHDADRSAHEVGLRPACGHSQRDVV